MKQNLVDVRYNSQSATIPLPHNRYIDKVLRSNSYEELMWRFKDADSPSKEISESYAAFSNLKKLCIINNFNWLHIGDGGHTRTAAIFAFFSKTINFSIDPALNMEKFVAWKEKYNIERIQPLMCKFEEVSTLTDVVPREPYSITCVHAHVKLEEVDKYYPNWVYLYSNVCCYPSKQTFSEEYMREHNIVKIVEKLDLGISSPERRIVIYKKLK